MPRSLTRLIAIPFVLALVVAVAGCGGSKKSTTTTTTTTTTTAAAETTTTTTNAATTTTAAGTATGLAGLGALGKCSALVSLAEAYAQAIAGTGGDPAKEAGVLQDYANKAPSDIRADFQVLAAAWAKFATQYKGFSTADLTNPANLAKMQAALKPLESSDVQAASQHISTWVQNGCH
jgi:hypothetical protein